ncbi:MAG: hypothetical protein JO053_06315 [Acidobacteria bacterium]|nr:hypothetical protein [Acidobacteriota bacterium]
MTFRIEKRTGKEGVIFSLSGRLDAEGIAELRRLLNESKNGHRSIVDLRDVDLFDREALRSLAGCELNGIEVTNTPAYVRDWMKKESRRRPRKSNGGKENE